MIVIIFPGVLFRVMVPTDGSAPGQGLLVIATGSGHHYGFAASLGLDLKENWGLDVISREERSEPHDQQCARGGKATLGPRPGACFAHC